MLHSFEDKVRLRAYEIWVSAGMAHGMAHDHWIWAEQSLMSEHAKPNKARAKTAAKQANGDAKVTTPKAKKQTGTKARAKAPRVTN